MPILVLLLLFFVGGASAEQATIQVLATTDMHGHIMPYDYFTAKPAERGLAKVATLIRQARAQNAATLLVDIGDTIQGSPLESVHQERAAQPGAPPDPMMAAMNALGYDAMVLGNHEFNYGLKNLELARRAARFPWLSANTVAVGGAKPFAASIVKEIGGVRVAFIGVTTPAIPNWEKPENYKGYSWRPAKEAAAEEVARARQRDKADVVILGVHAGLGRDLKTGTPREGSLAGEDMVYDIAKEVPGVDAILFGHSHQTLDATLFNGVLLMQPKNWAGSLGQIELVVEREAGGRWRVARKSGRLLPVTQSIAADQEIVRIAQPYHDRTEVYLNRRVTESAATLSAANARVQDTAIIDAIQQVQLHYAKADVSLTASFNPRLVVQKGPVTVRQIAALYIYENELFAVEGDGRMLREALENAARYFHSCADASCSNSPLINRAFFGFNFDMAQGVSYDIDLTQPPGSRIRNLSFRGAPLRDDQPLRIAINNYRAGGSGGYDMFRRAKVVWRSYEDLRELIIHYYSGGRPLPQQADGNWRIVPEAARQKLGAESAAEAQRTSSM